MPSNAYNSQFLLCGGRGKHNLVYAANTFSALYPFRASFNQIVLGSSKASYSLASSLGQDGLHQMPNFVNQLIHFFRRDVGLRGTKETEKPIELQQSSSLVCLRLDSVGRQKLDQESSEGQREQSGRKKDLQIPYQRQSATSD
jgi:hypothetical protein